MNLLGAATILMGLGFLAAYLADYEEGMQGFGIGFSAGALSLLLWSWML